MGNIVLGAITGVFIYITDEVLRTMVPGGSDIMYLIKFILQGWLTVIFVQQVEKFTDS